MLLRHKRVTLPKRHFTNTSPRHISHSFKVSENRSLVGLVTLFRPSDAFCPSVAFWQLTLFCQVTLVWPNDVFMGSEIERPFLRSYAFAKWRDENTLVWQTTAYPRIHFGNFVLICKKIVHEIKIWKSPDIKTPTPIRTPTPPRSPSPVITVIPDRPIKKVKKEKPHYDKEKLIQAIKVHFKY